MSAIDYGAGGYLYGPEEVQFLGSATRPPCYPPVRDLSDQDEMTSAFARECVPSADVPAHVVEYANGKKNTVS